MMKKCVKFSFYLHLYFKITKYRTPTEFLSVKNFVYKET